LLSKGSRCQILPIYVAVTVKSKGVVEQLKLIFNAYTVTIYILTFVREAVISVGGDNVKHGYLIERVEVAFTALLIHDSRLYKQHVDNYSFIVTE